MLLGIQKVNILQLETVFPSQYCHLFIFFYMQFTLVICNCSLYEDIFPGYIFDMSIGFVNANITHMSYRPDIVLMHIIHKSYEPILWYFYYAFASFLQKDGHCSLSLLSGVRILFKHLYFVIYSRQKLIQVWSDIGGCK